MKKDAYYFPHFSNARNDAKLIKLRRVLGIEGYGLYFMLLEVLREQTDFKFPINGIEDLAYEWHISKEKIASVIKDFDLFEIIELVFFSPKLVLYLKPYIEKSDRARAAANKRWTEIKDANAYANALPKQCASNASKVNKVNKVNKEIIPIFNFKNEFLNLGVEKQIIEDWLKVRKTKKGTNTETSFNSVKKQIELSKLTANECIKISV